MLRAAKFALVAMTMVSSLAMANCESSLVPHAVVYENKHWIAELETYPSRPGHTLIIPKRKFTSYFEISPDEWASLDEMFKEVPKKLFQVDLKTIYTEILSHPQDTASAAFLSNALKSPFLLAPTTDFTIAIDEGVNAGRTVDHLRIHLVPRHAGDVSDAIGGFRAMFPGDGNYLQLAQNVSALEAANRYYNTESTALQYFRTIRETRGVMPELALMMEGAKKNSRWLDIGFGPGIEFERLVDQGYLVDGLDISGPMKIQLEKILDKKMGPKWRRRGQLYPYSMQDFEVQPNHYDRMWAMATLLHVDRSEVAAMINKYGRGLKRGGKFFLNFKVGESKTLLLDSAGRPFTYFTEESFREEILPHVQGLKLGKIWIPNTEDALKRQDTRWLQIILEK